MAGVALLHCSAGALARDNEQGRVAPYAPNGIKVPTVSPQMSGTVQDLIAVSPVNKRVVWGAGSGGTFLVTSDGGRHWRAGVVTGAESLVFGDVQGVSERIAYLLSIGNGTDSRVYKTQDGGANWTLQFANQDPKAFYDAFAFWSPSRGLAFSDSVDGRFPVRRTTDGATWVDIGDLLPEALPGEFGLVSSGTMITTQGASRAWIGTAGASRARILATRDGGDSWAAYDTPLGGSPSAGIFSTAFRDARHGIIGGGDFDAAATDFDNFARSSDGGQTWHIPARAPVGAVFGLAYARDRGDDEEEDGRATVVVTGSEGGAWSADEGDSWTALEGLEGVTGLAAVAFADGINGWLVGSGGRVLKITMKDSCTQPSDCRSGLTCAAGVCDLPGSVGIGGTCWASRDCSGASYCSPTGTCAPAGAGSEGSGCVSDGDCSTGLRCDLEGFVGTCVAGGAGDLQSDCTAQTDCIAGLFCAPAGRCETFIDAFPPFLGVACAPDTGPFHSYFVVPRGGAVLADFFQLPYPNDARVSTQRVLNLAGFPDPGVSALGFDIIKVYTDALASDFDGFSIYTPAVFRFSGDIDFLSTQNAVHFVDLTGGNELAVEWGYKAGQSKLQCSFSLSVRANTTVPVLQPGHTYVAYLTTAVISRTGEVATADADLVAALGGSRPVDADLGHAWDAYAPFRAYLAAQGITPSTILNAAVFTTANPAAHMQRVAAAVAREPAPALSALFRCGQAGTDACDDGSPARTCGTKSPDFIEIHGKISMPIYQKGSEPYERVADGGALNETGGVVTKVRREDVCFALTLPKTTIPAKGWPLVIYGHGTGGSFREVIASGIAGTLATRGIAAFSFDAFGHGARAGTSTQPPSVLVFNVDNPPAARDGWLQGAADVLTSLKLPRSATPAGWKAPALKFDKVVYFGHSQGATAGELALPFTEDTHATVLSGAGAGLTNSLLDRQSPSNVRAELELLFGEGVDREHPIFLVWQNYFDRSDPVSTNQMIIQAPPPGKTAKHVFMTMGLGDTFSPQSTLAMNAAGLAVAKTAPILFDFDTPAGTAIRPLSNNFDGVFAAAFQYLPGSYDGHFVAQKNADAVRDWTAFITSYFARGTPFVP